MMLNAVIALYAQSLNMVALSAEEHRFLNATKAFAEVAGRCEPYLAPGFRERLEQQIGREQDSFRTAVMSIGLQHYTDTLRTRPSAPPGKSECDEQLGRSIAEVALANAALNQSTSNPPGGNGNAHPFPEAATQRP